MGGPLWTLLDSDGREDVEARSDVSDLLLAKFDISNFVLELNCIPLFSLFKMDVSLPTGHQALAPCLKRSTRRLKRMV